METNIKNILDDLHNQINECKKLSKKDFCVIGLGGKDSWLVTLVANDVFGYYKTLAVTVYSIFSNSKLPFKMASICQENNIQYCDVDISSAIKETLTLPIGLFRVEEEKLHYMMTDLQKYEIISMIRNIVLRGIADRHDAMLLTGINYSKCINGWVIPSVSMFDWNPLVNCNQEQVKLAIEQYNIGTEILEMKTGLDLNCKGGPFPEDYNVNLNDNVVKKTNIKNLGKGIYQ